MFWKFNASSPQIDTVLFKEDLTLNELLDQENVLQELKSQNKKLVEFITRSDVMAQLVNLVTEEPSSDLDERERYRRPNIACEVLTTDIPILNERLSEQPLLSKLYAFLEREPPLNPLLASFFSRTLSMLICRKADQNWYSYQFTCLQVLAFFKSRDNSLELLLKHLGTSAIMDLTLKILTQIEGTEMQQNILDWLENEGFIGKLIGLFRPDVDSDRHYNAAQLLCDSIRKLKENIATTNDRREGDPLLEAIQSPAIIAKLLMCMLDGELSESGIVGGISVLLALLEQPQSGTGRRLYNNQDDPTSSGEPLEIPKPTSCPIVAAIIPYLPKLHDVLINPPKKEPVKLACGTVEPPLGNTRLSIIKLLAALIATNTPEVNAVLDELNTVQVLLDLFFHYTWNNFLHTQVYNCLAFALNAPLGADLEYNLLLSSIFIKCRLLQRILDAWEENKVEQNKGGKRRGYMGHLTKLAITVSKQQTASALRGFLKDHIDADTALAWDNFYINTLAPINDIQEKCLGGKHPATLNEDKAEGAFRDIPFNDDPALQQSSYPFQNKNLYEDYDQNFGDTSFFGNNHINSQEDSNLKAKEAFIELCSTLNQIDPDLFTAGQNVEDEVWNELPDTLVWNNSDDEEEAERVNTEVPEEGFGDTDLWNSVGVGTPVIDPGNPWPQADTNTNSSQSSGSNEGWANFDANFVVPIEIEQQFASVQLTTDNLPKTQSSPSTENVPVDAEKTNEETSSASHVDLEEVPNDESEKSDNNANVNSLIKEDILPDDELIDNFRFLSKQGMMTGTTEQSDEQFCDSKEEKEQGKSNSGCATVPAEAVSIKNELPGDPV